jgi:hypothetical protein
MHSSTIQNTVRQTKRFLAIALLFVSCETPIGNNELALSDVEQVAFSLAQQQLDAYNNRDIDAFMEVYSDSVEIYLFPETLISQGKPAMRERYTTLFETTPELHCMLVKRIVQGNTVIDQELVTKESGEPKIQAIAIYNIAHGKIQRVYFIQ